MRVFSGVVLVIALAAPLTVRAQAPARLALADAVAEALARNPEIAEARRRHDAARERPAQVKALPDPMLSAGYNAAGNPLPGAGLGTEPTANIGAMVTQTFPYPGKRDLKANIAAREADAELENVESARLSVVARVKQAYYRLAYTYAIGDVLARNRELLDTLLKVSEVRYAAGKAAQQDVIKAQTQLSVLALQQERIARERATREAELNALLARPAGWPVGRPDSLELTPFTETLDAVLALAKEHAPIVRRERILLVRSQLGIEAAKKEYKPDFALSGGYFYMGSMPAMYQVRFDVTLPLQRERRAAAVSEQVSLAGEASEALQGVQLDVQARVEQAFNEGSLSARLALLYRDTVLPQARLALESSMASYETGTIDFLSVLSNFGTVLEYEMTYFEELATYHAAVSRLEEAAGTSIVH